MRAIRGRNCVKVRYTCIGILVDDSLNVVDSSVDTNPRKSFKGLYI